MKYTDITCPACNSKFVDGDDVVVCPECGTPHHRDCYNKIGHCVNKELHASGFIWKDDSKPVEEKTAKESRHDRKAEKEEEQVKVYPAGFAPNTNEDAPNGAMPALEVDQNGNARPVYRTISGKEKIGKYTVEQYGKVIQKNKHKYIPKFMVFENSNRKWSVNFAALIFGPFWMFYRKMYKYGIIALLITAIIPIVFMGEIAEYSKEYARVYAEAADLMMSDANQSEEELNAKAEEIRQKMPVEPASIQVSNYIQIAVNLVIALFGNLLYKEHCTKILDKYTEDEMLKRKGGTTLTSVLLALILVTLLTYVAAFVYTSSGMDIASLLRRII